MKGVIILFLISMAITCGVGGVKLPTYPVKAGVMGVMGLPGTMGQRREDTMYPEVKIIDGYRVQTFGTRIEDHVNNEQADYPWPQYQ
jgi:hypothetical protein